MRTVSIVKGISVGGHPQGVVSEDYTPVPCSEMNQFNQEGNVNSFLYSLKSVGLLKNYLTPLLGVCVHLSREGI